MILVKVIVNNKLLYDGNALNVYLNTVDKGIIILQKGCPNYVLQIIESIKITLKNNETKVFAIKEAIANFNNDKLEIIGN